MKKRLGTLSLWLLGVLLLFVGANFNDPYLIMLRGFGSVGLLVACLAVVAALIYRGVWGRGMFGTLLVLLWCLPPLAMAASKITFETRKQAVLHAEGAEVKDLGQHFITGYTSFAEVAPLAEKGLIGGIYISHHNIKGRTAAALKAEIASLQELRRGAGLAPLIVAADQEGGIVSHLAPQLTSLPALSTLVGSAAGPARKDGGRVRPHPWPRTRRPRRDAEFCAGGRPAPVAAAATRSISTA